ncbi:MAG: beta-galactosidase [Blastocatellales bacterium]
MTKNSVSTIILLILAVSTLAGGGSIQKSASQDGQPIRNIDSYPQFQLHGRPFFAHSAAFFYNRIPREDWGDALVKLKGMGINTIDLYIAWNWHEPDEGKLDFDGSTNPRRDVKHLLEMLDQMGFAVIARPGPVILNEWRNGGYPDWLLSRPEYEMNDAARRDGHYPPLSGLGASNSEEASRRWLANETHLRYTRKWFAEVMKNLLADRQATRGGTLIAIQLDDDQAINRANYNGPVFWQYMNTLAGYLREAGAEVPLYINPTDMRVSAAGTPHGIGAMGQWYFNFGSDAALRWEDSSTLQFYTETLKTQPAFPPMIIEYQAGWYGTGEDSYAKTADPTNTLLSSRLMIGHGLRGLNYFPVQDTLYPAGYEVPWANHYYTWESALNPALEERPRASAVHRNGRLIEGLGDLLGSARKAADLGLVYPISSFDQARLTRDDILKISRAQMQIQQFSRLNQMTVEYLDLEFQPVEHLKRHKAILLPVFDEEAMKKSEARGREEITAASEPAARPGSGAGGKLDLSETAVKKLVEYVNAGGILICTPAALPIPEFRDNPRVIVVPDFWRGVPLEPGKTAREEVISAIQESSVEFVSRLSRMGINRRVKARLSGGPSASSAGATIEPELEATQLVSGKSGFLSLVNFDQKRALSLNLNVTDPADDARRIDLPSVQLRPRDAVLLPLRLPLSDDFGIEYATAELIRREYANGKILLRFYAPDPAEAVLSLPHAPQGAITVDGTPATFKYDDQSKRLTVRIAPGKVDGKPPESDRREHDVEILYEKNLPQIEIKPIRLTIGQENEISVAVANPTAQPLKGSLELTIRRGLKSEALSQQVDVKPAGSQTAVFKYALSDKTVEFDFSTVSAQLVVGDRKYNSFEYVAEFRPRFEWVLYPKVAWPVRADTKQAILPPLVYPTDDAATEAKFNILLANNSSRPITLTRKSPLVTSFPLRLGSDEEYLAQYTYNFSPGTKSVINPFNVTISDGEKTEIVRVNLIALRKGEAVAFTYDIDRDGFDDVVMENDFLRLIISPNAGGRAFALINKITGKNILTSVGGLRDRFDALDSSDPTRNPRRKRGLYGTFNRPYSIEIVRGMGDRAIVKLSYDAPDTYPGPMRIEREIVLRAREEFFTVDYRVTPLGKFDGQSFVASASIAVGDPSDKSRRFETSQGVVDFTPGKSIKPDGGYLFAPLDDKSTFALLWRPAEVAEAAIEMKEFSSTLNVKFTPFTAVTPFTSRLLYYFGSATPEKLKSEMEGMTAR